MSALPAVQDGALVLPLPLLLAFIAVAALVYAFTPRTVHLLPPDVRRQVYLAQTRNAQHWREVDVVSKLNEQCPKTGLQYVVIGAGFLSRRIVHMLLLRGETRVRVVDLQTTNPLPSQLRERVEYVQGDITSREQMDEAMRGADVVLLNAVYMCFHQRLPEQAATAERINVGGARTVTEACKAAGVKALIYTSSAHASLRPDMKSIILNEDSPLATQDGGSFNHYCWTKAAAETFVCQNSSSAMRTAAVRPCSGIFGFDDGLVMQRVLSADHAVTWSGDCLDMVFVDNVVWGHLLCEAKLLAGSVAGGVFAVSNDEPTSDLEFKTAVQAVMRRVVKQPPRLTAFAGGPPLFIRALSHFAELMAKHFPGVDLGALRLLTPAVLSIQRQAYVYDCSKARAILGYRPLYTLHQSIEKSVAEFERESIL